MEREAHASGGERFARTRRLAGSRWLRLLVTVGLLAVVASHIRWSTMGTRIAHGRPGDFLIALALVAVSLVIGMARWRALLGALRVELALGRLARIYVIAEFSGSFLPATVGSDVTRTLLVARRGPSLVPTILSVVLDRAGGFFGLIAMAWIASAFDPSAVPHHARTFLLWVTFVLVVAALLGMALLRRGAALIERLTPRRLLGPAQRYRGLLNERILHLPLLFVVGVTSLVFQALIALELVFLARAIGVDLPYSTAAVSLALVTVATLLPISIGGFGVREGTYVLLLGSAGIGATDATLISLLSVATLFLASLPGAYFLVRGGLAPAIEEVAR
jgi:glycosyltransferase 2 family protein